ncbi:hypothetical protein SteCoe_34024 [Stentor coeruleus]|uniref:RCC1-like domain-containing protein n=1 Tax=Stentor coeruleus TaxID=5963 RepID=A0A1R2AVD9_9CILI|nr:hypothetical protein SteCoe_34024 [Stentor coeruleus]
MDSYTEVFAWGSDHFGQLGLGGAIGKNYSTPRLCTFNVLIKEISCGEEHAAFISSQGHVYTMGSNSDGRLGIDDKSLSFSSSPCLVISLSDLNPIKIACGWGHTACVTQNGDIYTWGLGEFGALGLGHDTSQWSPQKALLPENFEAVAVSCGSRHTAILGKNGRLALTGCGEAGQLGTKKREKELIPVIIEAENVVQVACGIFHTAFLNTKGQVFTMGGNSFGQLGHGNKKSTSTPERVKGLDGIFISKIACGYHTAAICDKGYLYVWGSGTFGEHLSPFKLHFNSRVKDVSVGSTFTVAVLQDMSVHSWGNNTNGELGLADYESRNIPTSITGIYGKKITQVSCGGSFCVALGNDVKKTQIQSRTPSHVRSYSKTEYNERKRDVRFKEDFSGDFTVKNDILKLEEALNDEKIKTDRMRLELNESKNQIAKHKAYTMQLEKNLQSYEMEILKYKDENQQLILRNQEVQSQYKGFMSEIKQLKENNQELVMRNQDTQMQCKGYINEIRQLKENNQELAMRNQDIQMQCKGHISEIRQLKENNQDLLIRNQDTQIQYKNYLNDIKQFKDENQQLMLRNQDLNQIIEENYMIKRSLENMKNAHLCEIDEIMSKARDQCENYRRELEQEKTSLKIEQQNKGIIEQSYQRLREENTLLSKQVEDLYCQIKNYENQMIMMKNEEMGRVAYEKENFHHTLSNKDMEIEKLSTNYHELMIQINRLAEENNIYKQNNAELEERNRKLFENLEKELAARAQEYRERTLTMLNAPGLEKDNRRSISPVRVQFSSSPIAQGKRENMSRTENMFKGDKAEVDDKAEKFERIERYSRTRLSETQQTKIGNTAARLLARMENDTALANMRISSPSRRSPERPIPFKAYKVGKDVRDILRTRIMEYRE